ncbi:ferric reductase-like transmembrane domain-containing protein [Candidatus Izemoplasma sp. B36]|uniref:ferric reductase-like transmembrane domain-containing protein n=1 Tax=Candidatus Izemoplasma sp. B36 TaxID=3242468 RepID=UPI003556C8AE
MAILAFILQQVPIFKAINQGYIGLSLFYIVMITGALPKKSKLRIQFSKVRKEFSIIGFILVTPHSLKYLLQFLNGEIDIPVYGIIVFALMIPLFITSFGFIRKKFTYNNWKKLQSLSYLIYLGLFIHMINVSDTIERINFILYIVLFTTYFILKIIFEIKRRKSNEKKT